MPESVEMPAPVSATTAEASANAARARASDGSDPGIARRYQPQAGRERAQIAGAQRPRGRGGPDTDGGEAQVAECRYGGRRLVVRRRRLTDTAQAALWPNWRRFGLLSDLGGDAVALDAFPR